MRRPDRRDFWIFVLLGLVVGMIAGQVYPWAKPQIVQPPAPRLQTVDVRSA